MIHFALFIAFAGTIGAELEMRDGQTTSVQIDQLNESSITTISDGQPTSIAAEEVSALRFDHPEINSQDKLFVRLRNGTTLFGTKIIANKGKLTIQLAVGPQITIPTNLVDYALLQSTSTALDLEREEILTSKPIGDVIIIRRPNQKLDSVEGVAGDITDDAVRFKLDEDWIDVRRGKVDGLWFFHPSELADPSPRCNVKLVDGSQLKAEKIMRNADTIEVTTTDNLVFGLPINRIRAFEYSSSKSFFLSDLEIERATLTPSLDIPRLANDLADLGVDQPLLPKANSSFIGSSSLKLAAADGVINEYTKGLAIHSRTELSYRLGGEYRQLQALAGLDPTTRRTGFVSLIIRGDKKELFRSDIRPGTPPAQIDLDLTGVNRLTILVDYGDSSDIADRLNLCDARLTK
ncbi:MAG: hypothetical protein GY768_15955 [Planctomycetaceae bacterium]|nr:hypothetical protein [Planctomycetaceae bacterium]